jgi:molecular chaperone GrpE
MSESAPAVDAGSAPRRSALELTPEAIEGVLADFRNWLQDAAATGSLPPPLESPEPPDLHTLLGQMIALRHEVNLQTKATRGQQEQNADTLRELSRAIDTLSKPAAPAADSSSDDAQRGVLKILIDIADALNLARREFARGHGALDVALQGLVTPSPPASSWLDRLLGRRMATVPTIEPTRIAAMLDSLVTGYTMSLQRVERALEQLGVARIECSGAFDPERMEAVDVVADNTRPPGHIVEVVRPGYLWRGRVFRFAQVSVTRTKHSTTDSTDQHG